jgi:hypothetical protein
MNVLEEGKRFELVVVGCGSFSLSHRKWVFFTQKLLVYQAQETYTLVVEYFLTIIF